MNILIFTHILKKIHKWDQEKCSEFQNQIDLRKIDELKKLLYEVTSMNLNIPVDKLKINSLLDNLCNILLNSAKSTFGTSEYSKVKHTGKQKLGKLKKDSLNDDCHFERRNFRKRKRIFQKSRTTCNENFDDFKLAEKRYKKVMDEAILAHRRKLSREINSLKSSNSQEFWKLLKKGKTREQSNIPLDKLFEFFKTLNEKPDADPINFPLLDPDDVNELNENINMKISKEILKCIKKLKNNKACGEDLVINEYIKSTVRELINLFFFHSVINNRTTA